MFYTLYIYKQRKFHQKNCLKRTSNPSQSRNARTWWPYIHPSNSRRRSKFYPYSMWLNKCHYCLVIPKRRKKLQIKKQYLGCIK